MPRKHGKKSAARPGMILHGGRSWASAESTTDGQVVTTRLYALTRTGPIVPGRWRRCLLRVQLSAASLRPPLIGAIRRGVFDQVGRRVYCSRWLLIARASHLPTCPRHRHEAATCRRAAYPALNPFSSLVRLLIWSREVSEFDPNRVRTRSDLSPNRLDHDV